MEVYKAHFKVFIILFICLTCFTNIFALYDKELKFNKEKKFRIVQITDLHYGYPNPEVDKNSTLLVEKLLNITNPDFIAITGDSVSGYEWDKLNKTFYEDTWKYFTKPFEEYKTPYGYTSGNHDIEADKNISEIIQLDITHPYSVKREYLHKSSKLKSNEFKYNVTASNFFVKIYSSESIKNKKMDRLKFLSDDYNGNKVVAIMWFFDTGRWGCEDMPETETYGCINSSQIEWYKENSRLIKEELGYLPKGFAFYHIPIPEYRTAYNYRESYGGLRREQISCPRKTTSFFEEVVKSEGIIAMFCGHDHNNDFCSKLDGVELCYGRKTGYGSYGPDGFQRGVRVIDLEEKTDDKGHIYFTYSQYVQQEDGTIQNQTYAKSSKGFNDFVGRCEF